MGHGEINYLMLPDQFDHVAIIALNSLFCLLFFWKNCTEKYDYSFFQHVPNGFCCSTLNLFQLKVNGFFFLL